MNLLKQANNPQALLQEMLNKSPHAQEISKLVKENGGDYEKAFRAKAKEMGIDPDYFIEQMK